MVFGASGWSRRRSWSTTFGSQDATQIQTLADFVVFFAVADLSVGHFGRTAVRMEAFFLFVFKYCKFCPKTKVPLVFTSR